MQLAALEGMRCNDQRTDQSANFPDGLEAVHRLVASNQRVFVRIFNEPVPFHVSSAIP